MKPKLLDLFCGAGGASMGYHRAGFEVEGVDNKPQPHYPFKFYQVDALTFPLEGYDAYHASPPCQGYSIMRNLPWWPNREYELLILPTKQRLEQTSKPFVIENVMAARKNSKQLSKIGAETHGLEAGWLCGLAFGLPFYRHRLFYTNWFWLAPGHPKHSKPLRKGNQFGANSGRLRDVLDLNQQIGCMTLQHAPKSRIEKAKLAMGIDWMTGDELSQAIPPAYTEYIGKYLLTAVDSNIEL